MICLDPSWLDPRAKKQPQTNLRIKIAAGRLVAVGAPTAIGAVTALTLVPWPMGVLDGRWGFAC
jgi:hypothetical protein